MPALTLSVNNFFDIKANATKLFLKSIWQHFNMTCPGPSNLTFPWPPYLESHVFRNFDFLVFLIRILPFSFVIFTFLDHFSVYLMVFTSF